MEHINLISQINLKEILTKSGRSLAELSDKATVMLVFLRHLGCVFCKEALKDLSNKKEYFNARGIKLVFVHMGEEHQADEFFSKYDLGAMDSIKDTECVLYEKFGLTKGSFNQLFGLKVMMRGFEASVINRNSFSLRQIGDGFQMPGIFLIQNGEIRQSYIHKRASDRPDYEEFISCCAI